MSYQVPKRYRFPASAAPTTTLVVLLSALVGTVAVVSVVLAVLSAGRINDEVRHTQAVARQNRAIISRLGRVQLGACRRSDRSDGILQRLLVVDIGFLSKPSPAVPESQRRRLLVVFRRAATSLWPRCPRPAKKGHP